MTAVLTILKACLTPRNALYALGVAGALYAYHWTLERGGDAREALLRPQISQLQTDLKDQTENVERMESALRTQNAAHDLALKAQDLAHATTLVSLKTRLTRSDKVAKDLKEKLDAILPTYITAKADGACTVPVGFVRFHDLSAKERPPATPQAAPVPASGPEDADAPSGIALSTVARTTADNYAECHARLEVVESWQTWYSESHAAWQRAVQVQTASTPQP